MNERMRYTDFVKCRKCNFTNFKCKTVVDHLGCHLSLVLVCGVDGCTIVSPSLRQFKTHLRDAHPSFYPKILYNLPFFSSQSVFCCNPLMDSTNSHQNFEPSMTSVEFENSSIEEYTPRPHDSLENINSLTVDFIKILGKQGAVKNMTFDAMKSLSTSLINYFFEISAENLMSSDLHHNLLNSINSSDNFDYHIKKNFNVVYPEIVDIRNTQFSFVYFSFKKCFEFLLSKLSSFSQIYVPQSSNRQISSFLTSEEARDRDTIYLNMFIDDFQLANPLLKKKSLKNSLTAIYFRILTSDNLLFSKHDNIHVLCLIKSNVFKNHKNEIFKFLSEEINPFLDNCFLATVGDESRSTNLKVGCFSTDSLAAASVLGYKISFNHEYCCRFCFCPRSEFKTTFSENNVGLRCHENYLGNINTSLTLDSTMDCFGLNKESEIRFLNISNYSELFLPCIDHDIFESILPKTVKFSLKYFIEKKYFTLLMFKSRVKSFKLFRKDKANFPSFEFDNISQIRFTASEGYTFSRFFLLFLTGVPVDDQVFLILNLLIEIILILMSFSFNEQLIAYLHSLIRDFLKLCSLYSESLGITVKFHHLIHYPRLITRFGPPRIFSTINFESLHSILKSKIKNSQNWKTPHLTIAIKYARCRAFSISNPIKEFGCQPIVSPIPQDLISFPITDSLTSILYHNNKYITGKNAILFCNDECEIKFILVEKFFKFVDKYLFYGKIHLGVPDRFPKILLIPSEQNSFMQLNELKSFFSYEVYKDNGHSYIVQYFLLGF